MAPKVQIGKMVTGCDVKQKISKGGKTITDIFLLEVCVGGVFFFFPLLAEKRERKDGGKKNASCEETECSKLDTSILQPRYRPYFVRGGKVVDLLRRNE